MSISAGAILDFHKTNNVFIYQSGTNDSVTTLGRVYFSETLSVKGNNINLLGDVKVPAGFSDSKKVISNFIVESDTLTIHEGVTIESGFQFLHANNTLELKKNAKVLSLRKYMCNSQLYGADLYTCMDNHALAAERL